MSLRWKISSLVVGSVLVTLLLSGLLVRQIMVTTEVSRARNEAVGTLHSAVGILEQTGIATLGSTVNDEQLPSEPRSAAERGSEVTYLDDLGGDSVVWAAAPVRLGTTTSIISVKVSRHEGIAQRQHVDTALWSAGAASLVTVAGLGTVVAGRLSRRLEAGARAARQISTGDGPASVVDAIGGSSKRSDEVDEFAQSVDAMARKLTTRLESEQAFTADLAHELRTPLAGLVAAAGLLDESRPAEMVRDRVRRLRVLVEDLLEISRLDARSDPILWERLALDPLVERLVGNLRELPACRGCEITISAGAPGATVSMEGRRMERILSNLVINAAVHGGGRIEVSTTPTHLVVQDRGPGYPDNVLDSGPTRFESSGGGMGLGLTIASRQAAALGWTLTLANTGSGARATVTWPEGPSSENDGGTQPAAAP